VPQVRIEPEYPPQAKDRGIEGWVLFQFTVTREGRVKDVVILDSQPKGIWDRATSARVSNWRYQPALKDGKPVEIAASRSSTSSRWSADASPRRARIAGCSRSRSPLAARPRGPGRAEDAARRAAPAERQAARPKRHGRRGRRERGEKDARRKDAEKAQKAARPEGSRSGARRRRRTPRKTRGAGAHDGPPHHALHRPRRASSSATRSTTSRTRCSRGSTEALNPYERALVYKYQAYNAYGKEQVPSAIELLRKALAENILTKQDSATSCSRSPRCRWARTSSRTRSRR
jgi:TonB family protein